MSWPKAVAVAIMLGLVAGAVVWYLERFEVARLHTEISGYLSRYDEFRNWEASHGDG